MKAVVLVLTAITVGVADGAFFWPKGLGFHCLMPCLHSFNPVCGSDGTSLRTFDNSCQLRGYSCWTRNAFYEIKLGECTGEEDVRVFDENGDCPDDWAPTCGTDYIETRTFPNKCSLHTFNRNHKQYYHLVDEEECDREIERRQQEKQCPFCNKIYWPVCGIEESTLLTFPNECVLRSYNCYESRNFTQIKSGDCSEE